MTSSEVKAALDQKTNELNQRRAAVTALKQQAKQQQELVLVTAGHVQMLTDVHAKLVEEEKAAAAAKDGRAAKEQPKKEG